MALFFLAFFIRRFSNFQETDYLQIDFLINLEEIFPDDTSDK